MKKIYEVMTPHAKCIPPDTSLVAAATVMRELDVGCLPVIENGELVGIVTDRDIAVRGVADSREPAGTPVGAIMSKELAFVFSDQDAEDAARLMEAKRVRRLPVFDHDNQLVGIVSLGDLAVQAGVQLSGEALQLISEPYRSVPAA